LWVPPKNSVKSEKYCSYGHLAGTMQQVHRKQNTGTQNQDFIVLAISA